MIERMLGDVELRELRIFLTLADELHFGRTAERLGVSQSVVSEAIRLLERRLGTRLFERTSRRVELSPAGAQLRPELVVIIDSLSRALGNVRNESNGLTGLLRLGPTLTTLLPPVFLLAHAFQARHPRCAVQVGMSNLEDPLTALRRGEVDVLVNWLAVEEPDLTVGPAIAHYDRVVVVGLGHRLAGRTSISVEELADEVVSQPVPTLPATVVDAILPPATPLGRPIRRRSPGEAGVPAWTFGTLLGGVLSGEIVHLTMSAQTAFIAQGLVVIPVHDLPPMPLGLIWRTAVEDARVRALAEIAREEGPWPADIMTVADRALPS